MLFPVLGVLVAATNLLAYHEYGYLHPESFLLYAALGVPALLLGAAALLHPALRILVAAAVVTLLLTLQLDLNGRGALTALILLCVPAWFLRAHLAGLLCVVFATMLLVTVAMPGVNTIENPGAAATDSTLPVYLHLVLDGHSGIDGIPGDVEGGAGMQDQVFSFFDSRGFSTAGSAYSRYEATVNALRNLFEFSTGDINHFRGANRDVRLSDSPQMPAYFRLLRDRGYALRIAHPAYIDYCSGYMDQVRSCYSYPSVSLSSIRDSATGPGYRLRMMLQVLLRQSTWLHSVYEAHHDSLGLPAPGWKKLPGNSDQQLARLTRDIVRHGRGNAHIIHALTTHAPFIRDANCEIQPGRSDWEVLSRDDNVQATLVEGKVVVTQGLNTPERREQRYQNYFDALRCNLQWLETVFDALEEAGLYEDAVVVVHSDHGSRIVNLVPVTHWIDQLSPRDFEATYSTLFAVKSAIPVTHEAPLPLEVLLARVVNQVLDAKLAEPEAEPFVFITSGNGSNQLVRLSVEGLFGTARESSAAGN